MDTITLSLDDKGTWLATYTEGPTAAGVKELFGTNTLPTAYSLPMTGEEVAQLISQVNPSARVIVADANTTR